MELKGLDQRIEVLKDLKKNKQKDLEKLSDLIFETIKKGNKLLTAGNGGSAANAQHITGEIVGRLKKERSAYPAISLTVDTNILTAVGNDYGYDQIFARQIEGIGKSGDLLFVSSSSGHSANIIEAVKKAKKMQIKSFAILGNNGGQISSLVDESIVYASNDSGLIEDTSMAVFHIILEDVEKRLVNYFKEEHK